LLQLWGFGHLARNYRNREIVGRRRRLEYGENQNNSSNLNEKESLVILD